MLCAFAQFDDDDNNAKKPQVSMSAHAYKVYINRVGRYHPVPVERLYRLWMRWDPGRRVEMPKFTLDKMSTKHATLQKTVGATFLAPPYTVCIIYVVSVALNVKFVK